MKKLICLFLIIFGAEAGDSDEEVLISESQGDNAPPGLYPFLVLLDHNITGTICSGSLIHPRWVLTAAHCLTTSKGLTVYADQDLSRNAEHCIKHPSFDLEIEGSYGHDVGLIFLESEFELGSVRLAEMWRTSWLPGEKKDCMVAGFGAIRKGQLPERARHGSVEVERVGPSCPCFSEGPPASRLLCQARAQDRSLVCSGDSGGPMLCEGKLAGISQSVTSREGCDTSTVGLAEAACDQDGTFGVFVYTCKHWGWISGYVPSLGDPPPTCLALRLVPLPSILLIISSFLLNIRC